MKNKRKYYRKCGVCGERHEQSEMIRTDTSPNGWLCKDCYYEEHPEYEIEEWQGVIQMTDKNLTDTEIKKALGECSKHTECESCSCMDECFDLNLLHSKALDLINRQEAEVERLKGWQDLLKAEAYKEFAEKVKIIKVKLFNTIYSKYAFDNEIDNLLNELVGDGNGE